MLTSLFTTAEESAVVCDFCSSLTSVNSGKRSFFFFEENILDQDDLCDFPLLYFPSYK